MDGGCPRDVFSTFLPSRRSLFSPSDSCTEDGGNWRVPRYRFTFMIFWGCVLSLCSASFSLLKQYGCRAVNWSVTLSPFRLPNLMHLPASEHTRTLTAYEGKRLAFSSPFPSCSFFRGHFRLGNLGFPITAETTRRERPEPGFSNRSLASGRLPAFGK